MKFYNLWALFFLILVPLLILLYFLKLKRPQLRIASTLLWQKVIEDLRVNSPFQRLKKSLLLLLQLILLLLLILSLARPWLKSRVDKDESIIVLLDTSASMQAKEPGGRTRLALAAKQISAMIDNLHHSNEMMLLTFAARARVVCSFTNNRKRLNQALAGIKPSECPTDVRAALRLAKSLAGARTHPRLLLFSDGSFSDPGKVELPMKIEYQKIGSSVPNLAITGMNVRRALHDPNKIEMFVGVQNFSDREFKGNMSVYLDDTLLDSKHFNLPAEKSLSQIFQATMPGGGILKVEFEVEDALKLDNRAFQVVRSPRLRRVLLVGKNAYYLEKALATEKNLTLTSISAAEYPEHADGGYMTVIWSNVAQPGVAPANNIYLGCCPKFEGLSADGLLPAPDIADWDNSHPVNRFIDFSNLLISETLKLNFPKDAKLIVTSSRGPIMGLLERDGRILLVSGFNIFKSNWPLQVSFVLFLHNCLNYFDARQAGAASANILVGGSLNTPAQKKPPRVKRPDGRVYEMARIAGGGYSFNDLERCGIYEILDLEDGELSTRKLAANLFSREESELIPVENPIAEQKMLTRVAASQRFNKEYFRQLLLVALVLLVLEWLIYHRRVFT